VFDLVEAPGGLDVDVNDLVVYDPLDRLELQPGDLMIGVGVGVDAGPLAIELVSKLGAAGAVGLVLKTDAPFDAAVAAAGQAAGIALLSVPRHAAWAQVLNLIRPLLSEDVLVADHVPLGTALAGVAPGDLFSLADTVADLIDAPVVIEDPQFRLLAYSSRQESADSIRSEIILGRHVPARLLQPLEERGIVRQVLSQREPMIIEDIFPGLKPRLVIAIRAGGAVLGTLTAAVSERPTPEKEKLFVECANLVALEMLRQRLSADAELRLRVQLLGSLLEGAPGVHDSVERLGLVDEGYRVLAMFICAQGDASQVEAWRAQLSDAVLLYATVVHLRAVSAPLGDAVYLVMAAGSDPDASRAKAVRIAEDFLERSAPRLPVRTVVGIGGHATLMEIPRARSEADQVVRVLRSDTSADADAGAGARAVAEIDDVSVKVMLMRLRDVASAQPHLRERRLARLVAHDERRGTHYLETLRIYLDGFGEVGRTSTALGIHPNTLRHRLGRIKEISGIDLDDPEARLGVMLELRLFPAGSGEAGRAGGAGPDTA
jgi:hypothetical protein